MFLFFSTLVIFCVAASIEVIHGGNIWGLSETLGFGDLFPVTFEAPQYVPPRACGDTNGDHLPDDVLFNCSAPTIAAAGMSSNPLGGDVNTWAVVSPRLAIMCTPEGHHCQPEQCCVDLGPDCAPQADAPEGVSTAWQLGSGGCSGTHTGVGDGCAQARMPDTETASECQQLVVEANEAFANGQSPELFDGFDGYLDQHSNIPNTWPPTVEGPINATANGVSWGRGSPEPLEEDSSSIKNHPTYKQCWAEFGMTQVVKNYFDSNLRLVDLTDSHQTCRLS